MSSYGRIEVDFSENLLIDQEAYKIYKDTGDWSHLINDTNVDIYIDPELEDLSNWNEDDDLKPAQRNSSDFKLSWKAIHFKKSKLKIDVKFEDPNLISPKQFQDTLVLKIKDPEVNIKKLFVSENDQRPLS